MAERPSIPLEPVGDVTTGDVEASGLPPEAPANPEGTGAVVARGDRAEALLGLDRSNTILTHR